MSDSPKSFKGFRGKRSRSPTNSFLFIICGLCKTQNEKTVRVCCKDGCGASLCTGPVCAACKFPLMEGEKAWRKYCGLCGRDLNAVGTIDGRPFVPPQ